MGDGPLITDDRPLPGVLPPAPAREPRCADAVAAGAARSPEVGSPGPPTVEAARGIRAPHGAFRCARNRLAARCYPRAVVPTNLTGDPPCPPATGGTAPVARSRTLRAVRRAFGDVDPVTWDALAARNPWATPFSSWAFHRAWWDGYGANAHEETLVLVPADDADDAAPVAIVPLMHRHEVEPGDVELRTQIRHAAGPRLTPVSPDAKAVFFGASLPRGLRDAPVRPDDTCRRSPRRWPPTAHPSGDPDHPQPWDAVDLRRLRDGDPAADALGSAFGRREVDRGLDAQRGARGGLSGCHAGRGRRHRRLPRHAGQEGAPRDPAQGPPRGGRRRGASRRLGGPAGGPARLHRPAPEALGRGRPVPERPRRATRAGRSSSACSSCSAPTARCASPSSRSAAAGSRRASRSRRPTPSSTTTPAWTPRRASCRRAWSWSSAIVRRALEHGVRRLDFLRGDEPLQVRVGRRGRAQSSACWSDERTDDDTARMPGDPCVAPMIHLPVPGPGASASCEVMATGTNGGAQEHVFNLVNRLDHDFYDVSIVSLSPGSAVRKLQQRGLRRHGDRRARRRHRDRDPRRAPRGAPRRTSSTTTCTGPRSWARRRRSRWARPAIAARGSSRPSTRRASGRTRTRRSSADSRPSMDHLIVVSKAIDAKVVGGGPRRRAALASSTTASTSSATTTRSRAARSARSTAWTPTRRSWAWSAAWSWRRATRRCSRRGRMVLAEVPGAYLLIVGEGSRLEALHQIARDQGVERHVIFTGRRDDIPAITAALDVAVLPSYREAQGLTILEAMALSRPVVASNVGGIPEMIEDGVTGLLVPPHDPPALAAAIVRAPARPPAGGHAGARRPRPGPRPVLRPADGERGPGALRRGRPRRPAARGGDDRGLRSRRSAPGEAADLGR